MPEIMYIVLTDGPGCGGRVYSVKATQEEAVEAAKKLVGPTDAIVMPWKVGSEEWDDDYMKVTNHRCLYGYESFVKGAQPS